MKKATWIVNRDANKIKKAPGKADEDATEAGVEGFPNAGPLSRGERAAIKGSQGRDLEN